MRNLSCILALAALSLTLTGCAPGSRPSVPEESKAAESVSAESVTAESTASNSGSAGDYAQVLRPVQGQESAQASGASPNVHLDDQSYYMDFVSKQEENSFYLSGTLHQNNNIKGLVKAEALAETVLSIKGSLTCVEGNIELLCRLPDGTEVTVAKGSGEKEHETSVDYTVKAAPGTNFFYFSGTDAVYDFQLNFSLSEQVSYYLTTSIPPDL